MLPLSGRKVWMGGNTLPTERHIRLVPMTSGKRLYACLPGHAGLAAHRGCLEAHSRSDPLHDCWRVCGWAIRSVRRSEEHTSELQSLMRISYAVFCLQKTKKQ